MQMQFVISMLALDECEFIGHPMHSDGPVKSLYFPSSHGAHVPPSGPEYPALHLQDVNAVLCSSELAFPGHVEHVETDVAPTVAEYFPAKQLLHSPTPEEFLNFPATHAVHTPPSGPEKPALQRQLVKVEL